MLSSFLWEENYVMSDMFCSHVKTENKTKIVFLMINDEENFIKFPIDACYVVEKLDENCSSKKIN